MLIDAVQLFIVYHSILHMFQFRFYIQSFNHYMAFVIHLIVSIGKGVQYLPITFAIMLSWLENASSHVCV